MAAHPLLDQSPKMLAAQFRSVMRLVPTAVTVVTGWDGASPSGMTVGTFLSVSLEPLMVGVLVARSSTTWPRIEATGAFCANVLSEPLGHLADQFAAKEGDRWTATRWSLDQTRSPRIEDCVAWFDCAISEVVDCGDHRLALGAVLALGASDQAHGPVVFHRGLVRRVDDLARPGPMDDPTEQSIPTSARM